MTTAVAQRPSFPQIPRPGWSISPGQSLDPMNADDPRGMFLPRKQSIPRSNSSSSVSSTSSIASASTVGTPNSSANGTPVSANGDLSQWPSAAAQPRKKPQPKGPWPVGRGEAPGDFARMAQPRPPMSNGGQNGMQHAALGAPQSAQGGAVARALGSDVNAGQPVLYLLSLNGTFERKTISVPFYPDSLRIGRQTNQKTIPTPTNGFFDSKVLSRQHAEIWADRSGKIWIRDVKSSNGTFVNGTRLSQENRESEPHELQTSDHLELGIDIVSEDQKTVVHHKVAAKVEHAGFLSPSNNVLEMNFGDLDPANSNMILAGPSAMQFRGRAGSNASVASNGRLIPATGIPGAQNGGYTRSPWLTAVTTEFIVKKLYNDMRVARQQSQDLHRTHQFVSALLSKDDVKDLEKPEAPEPPQLQHMTNGNSLPMRGDPKGRWEPPAAPPPQQPLPEKPKSDVPSLKRGTTERPKSHPSNTSPIRQDNLSQIIVLSDQLDDAKLNIRDLEEQLQKEREARKLAEDLAKRLEDAASGPLHMNGAVGKLNGSETTLEDAFDPPRDRVAVRDSIDQLDEDPEDDDDDATLLEDDEAAAADAAVLANLQSRLDALVMEMGSMRQQMESYRHRAEKAENEREKAMSERDEARKSLAEMVEDIRKREAIKAASRSRGRGRSRSTQKARSVEKEEPAHETQVPVSVEDAASSDLASRDRRVSGEESAAVPSLSRQVTVTPDSATASRTLVQDPKVMASLPYASMLSVVLIGMGLMAYLNGWQPQPKLDR